MSKRLTTKEFTAKARTVHADRYDYSQTFYINSDTPVTIKCKLHGPFSQQPDNHLAGKNCKQCATEQHAADATLTTEAFIAKAHKTHGDLFDYSNTVYTNSETPVIITCRNHGAFLQSPENHLAGKGCKHCAGNQHPSDEQIIQRFQGIHGDGYQYDLSTFTTTKQRLNVTCLIHGPFTVSYYRHLKNTGCPECTDHYNQKAAKYFVKRAKAIHGKKYRYGPYRASPSKIEITCPVHGVFIQAAAIHLRGHGCRRCANDRKRLLSKGGYSAAFFAIHPEMRQHPATLYLIEFTKPEESFIKIGITRTSIASRMKSGYGTYSWRVVALRTLCLYEAFCWEQKILLAFKALQIFPEQSNFVGKTECLSSSCVGEVESWLQDHDIEAKPSNSVPCLFPNTPCNPSV